MSVFGRNGSQGRETLLGYAHVHLPVFGIRRPAESLEQVQTPILMPKCPSMLADITSWLLRREPELKDPKVLLDNLKCKGLSMESYGSLEFQLTTVMREPASWATTGMPEDGFPTYVTIKRELGEAGNRLS